MSDKWNTLRRSGGIARPAGTGAASSPGIVPVTGKKGNRMNTKAFIKKERTMGTAPVIGKNDTLDSEFRQSSRSRVRRKGYYIADTGSTFTGKSFRLGSLVKQNPKGIHEEVMSWNLEGDPEPVIEGMIAALAEGRYLTVDKLYVIDGEESFEEMLNSEDNVDYFDGWYDHIYQKSVYSKTNTNDMLEIAMDGPKFVTGVNKAMMLFEKALEEQGIMQDQGLLPDDAPHIGLGLDGGSINVVAHNEVVRRRILGIHLTAKQQSLISTAWIWRNVKLETLALDSKALNAPIWITYKMAKDQDAPSGTSAEQPLWYNPASGYYASIWLNSQLVDNIPLTMIRKCRPRRLLVNSIYPYMTANLLLALCLGYEEELGMRIDIDADVRDRFVLPEELQRGKQKYEKEDRDED